MRLTLPLYINGAIDQPKDDCNCENFLECYSGDLKNSCHVLRRRSGDFPALSELRSGLERWLFLALADRRVCVPLVFRERCGAEGAQCRRVGSGRVQIQGAVSCPNSPFDSRPKRPGAGYAAGPIAAATPNHRATGRAGRSS